MCTITSLPGTHVRRPHICILPQLSQTCSQNNSCSSLPSTDFGPASGSAMLSVSRGPRALETKKKSKSRDGQTSSQFTMASARSLSQHMSSTLHPPPRAREQLCNRYCSDKHTHPRLRPFTVPHTDSFIVINTHPREMTSRCGCGRPGRKRRQVRVLVRADEPWSKFPAPSSWELGAGNRV